MEAQKRDKSRRWLRFSGEIQTLQKGAQKEVFSPLFVGGLDVFLKMLRLRKNCKNERFHLPIVEREREKSPG